MDTNLHNQIRKIQGRNGVTSNNRQIPVVVTKNSGKLTNNLVSSVFVSIIRKNWNLFKSLWIAVVNSSSELDPNSYLQTNYQGISAGTTLLNVAASHGGSVFVNFLMGKGADVNWQPIPPSVRPLTSAIIMNNNAVAELLVITYKAQVNYGDHGYSPLGFAAVTGNLEIVEILARSGANPNWMSLTHHTPKLPLIQSSSHRVSGWLLGNTDVLINKTDYHGYTALSNAVKQFIANRKVFLRDAERVFTLHTASVEDNEKLRISYRRILFYLRWGANPNCNIFHHPLLNATISGDYELVELLLAWGAYPKQKSYLEALAPYVVKQGKNEYVAFQIIKKWISPIEWVRSKIERDNIPDHLLNDRSVDDTSRKLLLQIKNQQIQAERLEILLIRYQKLWETNVEDLNTIDAGMAIPRLRRIAQAAGILNTRKYMAHLKPKENVFYSLPQNEVLTPPQVQAVLEYISVNKDKLNSEWIPESMTYGCTLDSNSIGIDRTTIFYIRNEDKCYNQTQIFSLLNMGNLQSKHNITELNSWWEPTLPYQPKLINQSDPLPLKSELNILIEQLSRIVWEINQNINVKEWAEKIDISVWKLIAAKYKILGLNQLVVTPEEWGVYIIKFMVKQAINLRLSSQNISLTIEETISIYETAYKSKAVNIVRADNVQSTLYTQAERLNQLASVFKEGSTALKTIRQRQIQTDSIVNELSKSQPQSLKKYLDYAKTNSAIIHNIEEELELRRNENERKKEIIRRETEEKKEKLIEHLAINADEVVAHREIIPQIKSLSANIHAINRQSNEREQQRYKSLRRSINLERRRAFSSSRFGFE